jgi:hypothetical protein
MAQESVDHMLSPRPSAWTRFVLGPPGRFLLGIVLFAVGMSALGYEPASTVFFLAATAVWAVGVGLSLLALYRKQRVGESLGALAAFGLFSALGAFAAFLSTLSFSRGRQLRSRGRVLLAQIGPDAGRRWAGEGNDATLTVPTHLRGPLAAQWRENARTEHASVAAFARLTLDLMALGAPAALVRGAQEDALDEIRHTELCFDLARRLDGHAMAPKAFPEARSARTLPDHRMLALATLAVDSLVDGALHEGTSARIIAKLARRAEDPVIRDTMREIARDEGRHAAHGWSVVEFCVAEGGTSVVSALVGALGALPATMQTALPAEARHGGWERYGIMGHALEQHEYSQTLAALKARVVRLAERGVGARAA